MTTPTAVAWDGVARGYIPAEPLAIDPGLARHETHSAGEPRHGERGASGIDPVGVGRDQARRDPRCRGISDIQHDVGD